MSNKNKVKITLDYELKKIVNKGNSTESSSKTSGIFKNFWKKITFDNSVQDTVGMAVAVEGAEKVAYGGPSEMVILHWFIKNQSDRKWAKEGNFLRNYCEDEASTNQLYIKEILEPGNTYSLNIFAKLP